MWCSLKGDFDKRHACFLVCVGDGLITTPVRLTLNANELSLSCLRVNEAWCLLLTVISHIACICSVSCSSVKCSPVLCSQLVPHCQVLLVRIRHALHLINSANNPNTSSGTVSLYTSDVLQTHSSLPKDRCDSGAAEATAVYLDRISTKTGL